MIYVDRQQRQFGRMKMCHMLADSLEELHEMADRLGMKRDWFQPKSTPHYDLSKTRRAEAVKFGAKEVSRRELVAVIRKWK